MSVDCAVSLCLSPGGFYIGRASSEANFPGSIVFSLIGYFLACYYFLQVGRNNPQYELGC